MGRRWIGFLLILVTVASLVTPVFAEAYSQLREDMKDSFLNETPLDISAYELTPMELQDIYDALYHSGQLPWYADEDCSYTYGENKLIKRFMPKVLTPRVYDRAAYEQKIAELMAAVYLPDMSDWQKALSVHDYIVLHTTYDEEMRKNTGYDCLVEGSTVCYGYSMLYMDVMNRLGIPCQIVVCYDTGDGDGHAWNIVQLDGAWYHVDLTWDDPVPEIYGAVFHGNFLKTDAEFMEGEEPHAFEWTALETVAEEPFTQDDFLEDVASSLCFLDANTVIFRRESGNWNRIISRDLKSGEEITLYKYRREELDLGQGWYLYPTYGLCLWNGRLYFNREDRVLSMLPDGSNMQQVYAYEPDDRYVIGCLVDDGILQLTLADHDLAVEQQEVALENIEYHTHSYHTNTVEATCQADGYYEMVCSCGISYNRTAIPQLDHLMQTVVEKVPTQQEAGVSCHRCVNCDYTEYEYPPALPVPENVREQTQMPVWIQVAGAGVLLAVAVLVILLLRRRRRVKRATL